MLHNNSKNGATFSTAPGNLQINDAFDSGAIGVKDNKIFGPLICSRQDFLLALKDAPLQLSRGSEEAEPALPAPLCPAGHVPSDGHCEHGGLCPALPRPCYGSLEEAVWLQKKHFICSEPSTSWCHPNSRFYTRQKQNQQQSPGERFQCQGSASRVKRKPAGLQMKIHGNAPVPDVYLLVGEHPSEG